jgi:hypothetical protein
LEFTSHAGLNFKEPEMDRRKFVQSASLTALALSLSHAGKSNPLFNEIVKKKITVMRQYS